MSTIYNRIRARRLELGLTVEDLAQQLGYKDKSSISKIENGKADMPLVGRIACGMPILAEQNIEGEVAVPEEWHADFILTCRGDSMAPQIMDGDLVAVRSQPEVENGEIAVVRIGDEATLKKVSFDGTTMVLQPLNPAYPLMTYTGAALAEVHIEGKAVGLCRGL